jgi:SAM-dependent methyltransferase
MSNAPTRSRVCAVCGSDQKEALFSQRFNGVGDGVLLAGYEVVACRRCGFCFADDLPEQSAFDAYYRDMSKYEGQHRGGGESEYQHRHYRAAAELVRQLLPDLNSQILDIGCASGGQLGALRQTGYRNVLGVDPSAVCAETALRLHGVRVRPGSLFDLPRDIPASDLVILGSVLEHIRDLPEALGRVRGLLAPGGVVYLEVPDATQFADSPDAPFQEFSIEHINYFSVASLANLLRAHGFSPLLSIRTATEQSPGVMAHEVKAAFRKGESIPPTARTNGARFTPDRETEKRLKAYIADSRRTENRIRRAIRDLVASGRPVIVWGVGTHTQRLLATGGLATARIAAFADSNVKYQGRQMRGIPVVAPAELKGRAEPILISSRVFQEEIRRQAREDLGLNNELITLYEMGGGND